MRAFVVMCLLATAAAAPQGYNYQQQRNSFQLPGLPQTSNLGFGGAAALGQQGNAFQQQTSSVQQTLIGGAISGGGVTYNTAAQPTYQSAQPLTAFGQNFGFPQAQTQLQQTQFQQAFNRQAAPSTVTKDIYVHVAPDEPAQQVVQRQLPPLPPRKHYRIVFIKAPTPSVSKTALRVQQAPTEEKTIIYVLTKKPDPLDLQAAFEEVAPKPPSKPEVYFIKYKTQEEAQHAQRTIQAQYDQLGGTTQISDEGIAPVTSVIGSLDNQQNQLNSFSSVSSASASSNIGTGDINAIGNGSASGSGSGSSKYLPPFKRV